MKIDIFAEYKEKSDIAKAACLGGYDGLMPPLLVKGKRSNFGNKR